MIKKATIPSKLYTKMSAKELAEATAEFDEGGIPAGFKPLDAAGRALWQRVKRKRGRPVIGKGVQVISVSLEKQLLAKANRLAKKLKVSRARLIARGLESVLAEERVK
jgi:hypothetical protein